MAKNFTDDFNRASLGSDWTADQGIWTIVSNELDEDSDDTFLNARLRYVADTTDGVDQYAKVKLVSGHAGTGVGFILRGNSSDTGEHYQVHQVFAGNEWKWEINDPEYSSRPDSENAGSSLSDGDWIGVLIEGTGSGTTVKHWNWGTSDPDSGGAVDIDSNWGVPDGTLTNTSGNYVDTGNYVGMRVYTGSKVESEQQFDDFAAGDYPQTSAASSLITPRRTRLGVLMQF